MIRTWVYQQMAGDSALAAIVGTRIFQSTAIDKAPDTRPFIMYRQTSDVEFHRGDDQDAVRSSGYMIFAHDIAGDYLRIDSILAELQVLFKDTNDQPNGIVRSRWVESSDDFRDDDMGTIFRYARLQVFYRV